LADLSRNAADLPVAIIGSTTGGVATTPVGSDSNGNLLVKDYADGPVTPGTVASVSTLIGGQYNTTLPTLSTTQQAALQVDSSGRVLISSIANALPAGSNVIGAVTQSGTWTVQQGTPPWTFSLPTGASTSANQTTMITSLQLIDNPVGPVAPGTVSTGSFLSGNIYNSTLPTFTNGQQGATQANEFGETAVQFRNKYKNVTASGTTVVKSGTGRLHGISFSQNSGVMVTIYDNTAASGTIIAEFASQNMVFIGPLGCEFTTGLTITQSGTNNITVYYQ
jgi:hypothetical protein